MTFDGALHRIGQIVQQVPAVGDLPGLRRSFASRLWAGSCAITIQHFDIPDERPTTPPRSRLCDPATDPPLACDLNSQQGSHSVVLSYRPSHLYRSRVEQRLPPAVIQHIFPDVSVDTPDYPFSDTL